MRSIVKHASKVSESLYLMKCGRINSDEAVAEVLQDVELKAVGRGEDPGALVTPLKAIRVGMGLIKCGRGTTLILTQRQQTFAFIDHCPKLTLICH